MLTEFLIGLGLGVGPMYPVSSKAIMDGVPSHTLAFAMSLKQTGPTVAGAIAALTLSALALAVGSCSCAVILSLGIVPLGLIFLAFYVDPPSKKGTQ